MKNKEVKIIRIYGIVQGVGFRPFVKREADRYSITGTVQNKGSYVEVRAEGRAEDLKHFIGVIRTAPPKRALIFRIEEEDTLMAVRCSGFTIADSVYESGERHISPDIAICPECERELFDKKNRRYLHPFITCTQCGPRFTVMRKLPYDRERTSMGDFPMCSICEEEYKDHASRMFDSQSVCCNECGPKLYILGEKSIEGPAAIKAVRKVIINGGIAAVKGIGGFHLCCSAFDDEAVKRLRDRKKRPRKPFAVMVKDIESAERECEISKEGKDLLTGYERPIVLLRKKEGGAICSETAPGMRKLGIMLPSAPVQHLLFTYDDNIEEFPDALIMTSGNVSGAPIAINDEEAEKYLSSYADIILSNDREILLPSDDSVVDIFEEGPYMVRRSRGYAPLPVKFEDENSPAAYEKRSVIAFGSELKNTVCVGKRDGMYLSSHIGDLLDSRSLYVMNRSIRRMTELLEVSPNVIVSDMHPGYESVREAEKGAFEQKLPLIKVQHHYAHILSVMAENKRKEAVIGAAFDGTGYGTDGSIFGGEIIKADLKGFTRLSHIKPFLQPGGDASAKEGWRIAVSMMHDLFDEEEGRTITERLFPEKKEIRILISMIEKNVNTVTSTSAGRLFDAVSAVLKICDHSSYEGEAAALLQCSAESFQERGKRAEAEKEGERILNGPAGERNLSSTGSLFKEICKRAAGNEERDRLSYIFHYCFAALTVSDITEKCERYGIKTAALSGGCFQNLLFLGMVKNGLKEQGIEVLTHSLIPANDGGIALGQCYKAMYDMEREG